MAEPWTDDPHAPSPVAPADYAQRAATGSASVLRRLSHEGRRIVELAQDEARSGDSNHVGTEHIVLGIIAHEPSAASGLLQSAGITRDVFLAQLDEEEGHAPLSRIPLTPRALMIVALAGQTTEAPVTGLQLLMGAIEESDLWRSIGRAGPHHLANACEAVGLSWEDLRQAVSEQSQQT